MTVRLPTLLWVEALMRRASVAGASGFVLQRGDADRGNVLLKISKLNGEAQVFTPRTDMDGSRVFIDMTLEGLPREEREIDAYLRRAIERDRDLWVVEIEDREGRHFITEPVKAPPSED
ncbi:MAG: DUF1491 family protein [Hyphomonadaceae bacterium]